MKLAILLTATVKVQVVGGNFSVEERAKCMLIHYVIMQMLWVKSTL